MDRTHTTPRSLTAVAALLSACSGVESVALGERVDAGTPSGGATGSGGAGALFEPGSATDAANPVSTDSPPSVGPGALGATREQFCSRAPGTGVRIPTTGQCTGDLAKTTFLFGLCSCSDLTVSGALQTHSFDSRTGVVGDSGSVGVSGSLNGNSAPAGDAVFLIDGSLWVGQSVGESAAMVTSGVSNVSRELHVGGELSGSGFLTVGADMFVNGPITSSDLFLTVGGALHVPAGASISPLFTQSVNTVREPVSVVDPCNCDDPPDVAAIVDAFANTNDNAASGVDSSALASPSAVVDLELDCGRYYFDRITPGSGFATVRILGRTAIFVDGDFEIRGLFSLAFGPDAELDLFVDGNVSLSGIQSFGMPLTPARFRMYVGGTQVTASGISELGVNLHAPRATFSNTHTGVTAVSGSLYAGEMQLHGAEVFHYDSAIVETEGCQPPGEGCGDCHDCSGSTPACNGQTCEACRSNADCCAPLSCNDSGECVVPGGVVR